jgi:hypothetical protein
METTPKEIDGEVKNEELLKTKEVEAIPKNKKEPDQCQFCDRRFESHLELDQHVVKEWTSRKVRNRSCLHCTQQSTECQHIGMQCETAPEIQARNWVRFSCRQCPETYFDKWSLDKHAVNHSTLGSLQASYEILEKLIMTQEDSEKSKEMEKTVMGMMVESEDEKSVTRRMVSCWSCHDVFTATKLRDHLRELPTHLTDWETMICENCQRPLIGGKQALQHFIDYSICADVSGVRNKHSGADNYLCHPCGKVFNDVDSLEVHMSIHLGENCEGQDPEVTKLAQTSNIGPHLLISKKPASTTVSCQQNNWCYDFFKKLNAAVPGSDIVKILNQHRCPVCERRFLCPLTLKEHQYNCKLRLC